MTRIRKWYDWLCFFSYFLLSSSIVQLLHLLDEFTRSDLGAKFQFTNQRGGSCFPLIYSQWYLKKHVPQYHKVSCSDAMKSIPAYIEKHNVTRIILASYWYVTPSQLHKLFAKALSETLDEFQKRGIRVLVVGAGPWFPGLRRECPIAYPVKVTPSVASCVKPVLLSKQTLRPVNLILRRAVDAHRNMFYWNISPYICPMGMCTPYYKGKLLYWEQNHYNEIIGRDVAQDILRNYGFPTPFQELLEDSGQ